MANVKVKDISVPRISRNKRIYQGDVTILGGNGAIEEEIEGGDIALDWAVVTQDLVVVNRGLTSSGIFTAVSDAIFQENLKSPIFGSGFAGEGWKMDTANNRLTVDYLTVRKEMLVYELIINQIRGTNGSVWVSDSAKIENIDGAKLYIDTGGTTNLVPFVVGDFIKCQRFSGNNIKNYTRKVTAVGADYIETTDVLGSSNPEIGDIVVRIGNETDTDRQGSIYLTASDNNAPYIDVLDGVNTGSLTGKTKVRIGRLDGINAPEFGNLSGYGLFADNVFLKGNISANSGNIGNFNIIGSTGEYYAGLIAESAEVYFRVGSLSGNRYAALGTQVFAGSEGGYRRSVSRFHNTAYSNYSMNYAVFGYARNAGNPPLGEPFSSYAGYFDGNVRVTNGVLIARYTIGDEAVYSLPNYNSIMPSGYNLYFGDLKTADRDYTLPAASDFEAGEIITISNWNTHDANIRPKFDDTINGYIATQRYIRLREPADCVTLRSNGINQWAIISAGGSDFAFA